MQISKFSPPGPDSPPGLCAADIRRATPADRLPLARMLELYQYELSDIWDQDLDAHGEYGYELDRFWRDPACHAFVATVAGCYAGLALVDGSSRVGNAGPGGHWMNQFFVLKKYRRLGLGRQLARTVFEALPGPWEVGQMSLNYAAQGFWRQVVAEVSGGQYQEHVLRSGPWQGVVQVFESAVRRPPSA
jgi:predicted acetyltransferase